MLKLKNITKDYVSGDLTVNALKGVSIDFRVNEFVSILGPSGCGKTTLLNIMGGLDKYTDGDLEINGVSTVNYKDRDWDNYRNNSIGFVFQSYNLIMHQSVLANVELALTLSGVSKVERKQRAKEALIKVGLESEIHKMPNQLSGGQMQRVAIARAIVNNPDIVLADEPTGALDTETSIQVMDILKDIAKDRLVIMVTHNPDLAKAYSNRIISMSDGLILDDTNPLSEEELNALEQERKVKREQEEKEACNCEGKPKKKKMAKMSIWTAFSLSLKNLITKKARTILTSFAGSIGIIGIALILSVSAGFQSYIDNIESGSLSSQPILIQSEQLGMEDISSLMGGGSKEHNEAYTSKEEIYPNKMLEGLMSKFSYKSIDLSGFKYYLENNVDSSKIHGFRYNYGSNPIRMFGKNVYINEYNDEYKDKFKSLYPYKYEWVDKLEYILDSYGNGKGALGDVETLLKAVITFNPFSTPLLKSENGQLKENWGLIAEQYEVLKSARSDFDLSKGLNKNQVLLVVDSCNNIPDSVLIALGLRGEDKMLFNLLDSLVSSGALNDVLDNLEKDPTLSDGFSTIITDKGNMEWSDYFNSGEQGAQAKEQIIKTVVQSFFGYTYNPSVNETPITFKDIMDLNADPSVNRKSSYKIIAQVDEYQDLGTEVKHLSNDEINALLESNSNKVVDVEIAGIIRLKEGESYGCLSPGFVYSKTLLDDLVVRTENSSIGQDLINFAKEDFKEDATLAEKYKNFGSGENLKAYVSSAIKMPTYVSTKVGKNPDGTDKIVKQRRLTQISLYASSFENKEYVKSFINEYNRKIENSSTSGVYGEHVDSSDMAGDIFKTIDVILNAITYVLIAFVGISLIVSSIMIGIITYISVLERTKEIGVLRSIGASKKDVGRVFTAETVIIGFVSGLLGVIFAALLTIPIRAILKNLTSTLIPVALPFVGAIILVVVSVLLTLVAGLIPSRLASKKDPVVALRSE